MVILLSFYFVLVFCLKFQKDVSLVSIQKEKDANLLFWVLFSSNNVSGCISHFNTKRKIVAVMSHFSWIYQFLFVENLLQTNF